MAVCCDLIAASSDLQPIVPDSHRIVGLDNQALAYCTSSLAVGCTNTAGAFVATGGSRRPVSTYLAICEGAKLVLLLPPDQTLLPAGGDPNMLLNPTQQFLDDVKGAGGYFFVLEDLPQPNKCHNGNQYSSLGIHEPHDFSATALYMPAGWYHWLVGLTDWHIVYGGSFYPEQQKWLQQQS